MSDAQETRAEQAPGYLSAASLDRVRAQVPILCVDVLPYRGSGNRRECLLIKRLDRDRASGWSLIGGRVWIGESLGTAVHRHLVETLGGDVRCPDRDWERPELAAQYSRERHPGRPFDPAQHAVALSYNVELEGAVSPAGEALGAAWFTAPEIPAEEEFVFGHGSVVRRLLAIQAASPR